MTGSSTTHAPRSVEIDDGPALPAIDMIEPPTARPKIVYLVRREGLGSVFTSQVVRPMSRVAERGFDVEIVVLCPFGQFVKRPLREQWARIDRTVPQSLSGRLKRVMLLPSRFEWEWLERKTVARALKQRATDGRSLVVQCRNATTTNLALHARRQVASLRVVYDCRGIEDEEFLYQRRGRLETPSADFQSAAGRLAALQRRAVYDSDAIVCVSEAMVDYLVDRYGIDRTKCIVVPCCVEVDLFSRAAAERDTVRSSLGLGGRFVAAYCGSLAAWQLVDQTLELFLRMRAVRPESHFLALTMQPEKMRQRIASKGLSPTESTVVSARPDEVPRYLAAADCGFLLREASPVNQVASPVKFAEYLAGGVPVILTEGIGDYSQLVQRERVGLIVPPGDFNADTDAALGGFLNSYQSDPASWRSRCLAVARERLDGEAYLPRIEELYSRLAGDRLAASSVPAGGTLRRPTRPIRVLHVISGRFYGGGQRVVLDLLRMFSKERIVEPRLCTLGECADSPLSSVPQVSLAYDGRYNSPRVLLGTARRLRRVIDAESIDLVHSHGIDADLIAALALWGRRERHVCHLHVSPPAKAETSWKPRLRRRLLRGLTAKRPSWFIAVADSVRQEMSRYYRLPLSRITTVRNGIDPGEFDGSRERDSGPDSGRPVVLGTAARLERPKGIEFLIRAGERLAAQKIPFEIRIAGDGKEKPALEGLAHSLNIADRVRFLGTLNTTAMPEFYRSLDVFVLPSLSEGLPLVLLEAMAAGTPVAASRLAGIPEAVRDGLDGVLVRAGDVDALALALTKLAVNPAWRRELGSAARDHVRRDFNLDRVAAEIEKVYQMVLEHGANE